MRPPRYLAGPNAPLEVYSQDVSVGEELLARAGNGQHRNEGYVFYDMLPLPDAHAIVCTRESVLYVSTGRRYSYMEWSIAIDGECRLLALTCLCPPCERFCASWTHRPSFPQKLRRLRVKATLSSFPRLPQVCANLGRTLNARNRTSLTLCVFPSAMLLVARQVRGVPWVPV